MVRAFRLSLTLLAIVCLSAAMPLAAEDRVVAVGDIHGDYDNFVTILRTAGLVDAKTKWSGGRTTLVVTGDFFDRGPAVRKVMDLLMSLEKGASRKRGRVIVLLGNHEAINLASDFPYLNSKTAAAFADRRSEKRRAAAFREYVAFHKKLAERYGEGALKTLSESEWMTAHPPGWLEYQQAISAEGKYGRWLRSKQAIAKIGDTVFVHGGISPGAAESGIEKLNSQVRIEIEGVDRIRNYLLSEKLILPFFDFYEVRAVVEQEEKRLDDASENLRRVIKAYKAIYQWGLYNSQGPLWFRGYAEWSDEEGEAKIGGVLQQLGARRLVVGHTMPAGTSNILPRFGGRVFLIDTGMLSGMVDSGRPSALEIIGNKVRAIYESGPVDLTAAIDRSMRRIGSARRGNGGLLAALPRTARRPVILLAAEKRPGEPGAHHWRGPDDTWLPFTTPAEVTGFLRGAKLVKADRKRLSGATKPMKLSIENGGVRARAVFRSLHREQENARWESGEFTEFLRDSWKSEIAAYELGLLLGIERIPPTVPWRMKKVDGSMQLWIEKARAGWHENEKEKPADPELWERHLDSVRVFDALIGNIDRHIYNMLIDSTGRVWWIDHTRAFGRQRELRDAEAILRCERRLWDAIRAADPEAIARTLRPYMSQLEIDALLERRVKLIALIEKRIVERGEAAALFTIAEEEALLSYTPAS